MSIETYGTSDSTYIEKIKFAVFGNQEVVRYSVIDEILGITVPEAYDNGEPKCGPNIRNNWGRRSSVGPFAPTILRSQIRIQSTTTSILFSIFT